jgi:hypothetical protein
MASAAGGENRKCGFPAKMTIAEADWCHVRVMFCWRRLPGPQIVAEWAGSAVCSGPKEPVPTLYGIQHPSSGCTPPSDRLIGNRWQGCCIHHRGLRGRSQQQDLADQ